ncbi:MAG: hypothetical protein WDM79_01670 [Terricaulis sp.]
MRKRLAALFAASILLTAQAQAATTARDLQVIARAVGFIDGLPRGAVDVAIVDGPGADALFAALGRGVTAGGVTLNPRRVSVGALASSGVRVIIVPEGQTASHAAISAAAARLGAVTLSTDMGCVRSGRCVVGVSASPRVEIVVSRAAARLSRVSFSQAFRVMIREI